MPAPAPLPVTIATSHSMRSAGAVRPAEHAPAAGQSFADGIGQAAHGGGGPSDVLRARIAQVGPGRRIEAVRRVGQVAQRVVDLLLEREARQPQALAETAGWRRRGPLRPGLVQPGQRRTDQVRWRARRTVAESSARGGREGHGPRRQAIEVGAQHLRALRRRRVQAGFHRAPARRPRSSPRVRPGSDARRGQAGLEQGATPPPATADRRCADAEFEKGAPLIMRASVAPIAAHQPRAGPTNQPRRQTRCPEATVSRWVLRLILASTRGHPFTAAIVRANARPCCGPTALGETVRAAQGYQQQRFAHLCRSAGEFAICSGVALLPRQSCTGPQDFSERDAQFARGAGAGAPVPHGTGGRSRPCWRGCMRLIRDRSTARWAPPARPLDRPFDLHDAWQLTGGPEARKEQIRLTLAVGQTISILTRKPLPRTAACT